MTWQPAYATVDELRRYLRLPTSGDVGEAGEDADNDAVYGPAIEAASRAIDKATSRQFGTSDVGDTPPAVARRYTPVWRPLRGRNVVSIDDLMSTDDLVVATDLDSDGTYETTITDYVLLPLNAAASSKPWTDIELRETASRSEGTLEITAHWGWSAVPDTILSATLLQASRIAKRRDAPFGVAGSPDLGSELRLLAKLDPDVAVMVGAYRRYW
jgi:hypothetical protein